MNQIKTQDTPRRAASWLGFWAAILTTVLALTALATGVTTPPRSGPFCLSACITYPYTDAAAFVPRDYLWMYPSLVLAFTFVVLLVCLHYYAPGNRKVFSLVGLCFASISAALLSVDYFIQLAVLQPSLLMGEAQALSLFTQYNPHGVFIALEDLGYLLMGVALLFVSAALVGRSGVERAVRWLFIICAVATIASLIGLSLAYGRDLEYRYEVTSLSINWLVLIVSGILLAILFRRAAREEPS